MPSDGNDPVRSEEHPFISNVEDVSVPPRHQPATADSTDVDGHEEDADNVTRKKEEYNWKLIDFTQSRDSLSTVPPSPLQQLLASSELAVAIESEDPDAVRVALEVCTRNVTGYEPSRKNGLLGGDQKVLLLAAQTGNASIFTMVFNALQEAVHDKEERDKQLMAKDKYGVTVLMHAVRSGSHPLFNKSLHYLRQELTNIQVMAEFSAKSFDGATILLHAVRGGNTEIFQDVVGAMVRQDQLRVEELIDLGVPVLDSREARKAEEVYLRDACTVAGVPGSGNGLACVFARLPHPEGSVQSRSSPSSSSSSSFSSPLTGFGNYFEVTIERSGRNTALGVGFADPEHVPPFDTMPGFAQHSYGYHGRYGGMFRGRPYIDKVWRPWVHGDVVGCGFDSERSTVWYTLNGKLLGGGFQHVKEARLVPVVGFRSNVIREVRVNFGIYPFLYQGEEIFVTPTVHEERRRVLALAQERSVNVAALFGNVKSQLITSDSNGVTPLLEAARSADIAMFALVLGTLKETVLQIQVVSELLTRSNNDTVSLLTHAELGGSREVILAVEKELADAVEFVSARDRNTNTSLLLQTAKKSDLGDFSMVLHSMLDLLSPEQVMQQVVAEAWQEMSPLILASSGGSLEHLPSVIDTLRKVLSSEEVVAQLVARNRFKETLLMLSARLRSPVVFSAVLDRMIDVLGDKQVVEEVLTDKGLPLLVKAIKSGTLETFSAVLGSLVGMLGNDQGIGTWTVAMQATISRSLNEFSSLLRDLQSTHTNEQVMEQFMTTKFGQNGNLHNFDPKTHHTFEIMHLTLWGVLDPDQMVPLLVAGKECEHNLLMHAVKGGSLEVFSAVLGTMCAVLTREEVVEHLMSKDQLEQNLLMHAVVLGSQAILSALLGALRGVLSNKEMAELLTAQEKENDMTTLMFIANGNSSLAAMDYIVNELERLQSTGTLSPDEIITMLSQRTKSRDDTVIMLAARDGTYDTCLSLLQFAELSGYDFNAKSAYDGTQKSAMHLAASRGSNAGLDMVGALVQHGAVPEQQVIVTLVRKALMGKFSEDHLVDCFLRAVASAQNPLIPGVNLLKQLGDPRLRAPETRRVVLRLQFVVNELLQRVLGHLPGTVRSFAGNASIEVGMCFVGAILEPENHGRHHKNFIGPLRTALEGRRLNVLSAPIVLDFLSLKFGCGIPSLLESWSRPDDREKEFLQANQFLIAAEDPWGRSIAVALGSDADVSPGRLTLYEAAQRFGEEIQGRGADADEASLTILAGAQFTLAGIAARSMSFYLVPAVRMAFEFLVYVAMLCVFSVGVAMKTGNKIGIAEGVIFIYTLGAMMAEVRQAIFVRFYFSDRWNRMDIFMLVFLGMAFFFRVATPSEQGVLFSSDAPFFASFFYAVSAPLLFSRTLFYAQIFPAQGPMVQVIFSMLMLFLSFSILMAIVMLGFATAFLSLFHNDDNRPSYSTFGNVLLTLFQSMLGNFDLDELSDHSEDEGLEGNDKSKGDVGVILMIVYLTVMAIILLNLLIAVLSTAHSNEQDNIEKKFWASRAEIIMYYTREVGDNVLPAPFNLVQELLCQVAGSKIRCHQVREAVGRFFFWLVLGPLAITAVAVLWAISIPKILYEIHGVWRSQNPTRFWYGPRRRRSFTLTAILLCFGGAPLYLTVKWFLCLFRRDEVGVFGKIRDQKRIAKGGFLVDDALDLFKDKVSQELIAQVVREQIKDPMVWGDEDCDEDQPSTATVEHMKRLRDHVNSKSADLETRMEGVEAKIMEVEVKMTAMELKLQNSINLLHKDMINVLSRGANSNANVGGVGTLVKRMPSVRSI